MYSDKWGLVLSVPKEAQDYISNCKPMKCKTREPNIEDSLYKKGLTEGENFNFSTVIGEKKEYLVPLLNKRLSTP